MTEPEVSPFLGNDLGGPVPPSFCPRGPGVRVTSHPQDKQPCSDQRWHSASSGGWYLQGSAGGCSPQTESPQITLRLHTLPGAPRAPAQSTDHGAPAAAHAHLSTGRWEPGPQATPQAAHCNPRLFAWDLGLKTTDPKTIARMQFGERKKLATLRLFSRYVCILCGKRKKILHVDIQGLTLSLSSGKIPVTLIFAVNSEFKDRAPKQRKINFFSGPFLGKLLTTFT